MRGGKMKAPARDKPLVGGSSSLGPTSGEAAKATEKKQNPK